MWSKSYRAASPPVDPFSQVTAADFRTLVLVAAGELQRIAVERREQDETNSGWQRELSISYERLAMYLVDPGRVDARIVFKDLLGGALLSRPLKHWY